MPPKTSFQKIIFTAKVNLADFVITFNNFGFDLLPIQMKKFLVLFYLLSPILAIFACLRCTQEEDTSDEGKSKRKSD